MSKKGASSEAGKNYADPIGSATPILPGIFPGQKKGMIRSGQKLCESDRTWNPDFTWHISRTKNSA
jgi:hypothetical protein